MAALVLLPDALSVPGPGRVEATGGECVEVWGDGLEAWAYLLAALPRFTVLLHTHPCTS